MTIFVFYDTASNKKLQFLAMLWIELKIFHALKLKKIPYINFDPFYRRKE